MAATNDGLRLERYEIVRELGQGGMGVVYEAIEALTERRVALKVLRPELLRHEGAQQRFRREIKTLCALEHPNIVRLHSAFEEGGRLVLVQELLVGETLEQALARAGQLDWHRAVDIARDVARALDHAHRQSPPVAHRDVKPSNVVLCDHGGVKLLDFGIARAIGQDQTETRSAGSLLYQSPEQIDARALTPSTDLYNLGLLLFEMLMGGRPFEHASNRELLQMQCTAPPPPVDAADTPAALAALVAELLAKTPESRPPTAAAVIDRLDRLDSQSTAETVEPAHAHRQEAPAKVDAPGPAAVPDEATPITPARPTSRRWPVVAVAAVAAVALVGWGIVASRGEPEILEVETASPIAAQQPTAALVESATIGVRGVPLQTPPASPPLAAVASDGPPIQVGVAPPDAPPATLKLSDLLLRPPGMLAVSGGIAILGSTGAQIDAAIALCERDRGATGCARFLFEVESPQTAATLGAFLIDKHEVSVAQYQDCVDEGGCSPVDTATCNEADPGGARGVNDRSDHPVSCVTFQQASAFCAHQGRRLPTAAEWARAARGTDSRHFPWGDDHPSAVGRVGNFADATALSANPASRTVDNYIDGFARKAPVGVFPAGASPVGALDMAGNVAEWTSTGGSGRREVRGGSFVDDSAFVRAAVVESLDETFASTGVGFRCALSGP